MNISEGPKRHRPSQTKIDLDVYFLPERLPMPLRYPLDAAGGPDALIRIDQAEGHLSPSSDGVKGWQITLTVCPPGEGHFMGIDLSIPEAKRLIKVLDYVIEWQKGLKAGVETKPKPGKKHADKTKKARKTTTNTKKAVKIKGEKKGRP